MNNPKKIKLGDIIALPGVQSVMRTPILVFSRGLIVQRNPKNFIKGLYDFEYTQDEVL